MQELLDFLKLSSGFVYLLIGGDLLVRGGLGLSRKAKIPPVVVGLTVVAMGTSAPELMISTFSALSGYPGIAIGNVIGSNIANVLLVLGVPVFLHPIVCNQEGLGKQTGLMIAVSMLFIAMCLFEPIGFWEGFFLMFILAGFLIQTTRGTALMPGLDDVEEELQRKLGLPGSKYSITLFILLGTLSLPLGAYLVVEGGVGLATGWGISESVIGLSLVALGTSLPELSTTMIAAMHKSSDVALGNVIGSNLFNILAVIGVTSMIVDIPVEARFVQFDLWVMFACATGLWLLVLVQATIGKIGGLFLLAAYVAYICAIF